MKLVQKIISGWSDNRRGSTAIEFALVAIPFVMIVTAIIEISVMFAAHSIMLGATQDAVRAVRTGQLQAISDPDEADSFFREQLCRHIPRPGIAILRISRIRIVIAVAGIPPMAATLCPRHATAGITA